jgi:hypothetical protein
MTNDSSDRISVGSIGGGVQIRRFDTPDQVLAFDKGRLEVITVGRLPIGKGSYLPGWKLSQVSTVPGRVGDREGGPYVAVLLSGRAKILTDGERESDLTPGDFFCGTRGHDFWVVGYRPCEILYLAGLEALASQLGARSTE